MTLPPSAHTLYQLFERFHFFTAGDQLVVPIGVTHISFLLHQKQSREQEKKKKNKTLGLSQVQKESYVTLCMCRLTLVWTLAKLPQSYWNADSSWLDLLSLIWTLSHADSSLCCPVSTASVRRPSPTGHFSVPLSHSLTGVPSPLPVTSRSRVQNPLSGFAPKQTKEASAWRTTYIVLQYYVTHSWGDKSIIQKWTVTAVRTCFLRCRI